MELHLNPQGRNGFFVSTDGDPLLENTYSANRAASEALLGTLNLF